MADRKMPESPVQVCRRRRISVLNVRGWIGLLIKLVIIFLAVWILLSQVFLITQCQGMGMFPSIEDGDLIFGYRLQNSFDKGDVVIYRRGDAVYIGRVAALETASVMLDDSGNFTVNGTTQGGDIMYPTYAKEGIEYPYRVQEGHVFVLGDYRTQAQDSRDFGSIPLDNILGKVITIVRRRGV